MKFVGTVFAFAISACAVAHAQPDFVKHQAWDQVQRSQMNMMIGRAGSNSGKDGGAGMPAYVKVFAKEKTYQGIGQFRLQEGSNFKGIKETAYTPIAYAFLIRDRDYAIRLFDKYNGIDVYDPKAGLSLSDLRRSVFHDGGDWAQEMPKPADGLIQRLAKVRRACQARKYADGLGAIGELEGKFPDFYLPYALEGECYEKQGNQKAALEAYQQARLYAPADAKLLEVLSGNISRTQKAARGK